jgi:uncharacterized protein
MKTNPLGSRGCFLAICLAIAAAAVTAAPNPSSESSPAAHVMTAGFLAHHPDLKHRMLGIEALDAGTFERALGEFKRSARYADKASQAMVAEMLWEGMGVPADRPAAYAWMDLAAERSYPSFLALRERYWASMDAGEQAHALKVGQGIYAEYGDDVAKPRLERMLRRGLRAATGSRVGNIGNLTINIPGPGGWMSISGNQYYADHYWRPAEYFAWQDSVWRDPPSGQVDIGPIDALRQRDSR